MHISEMVNLWKTLYQKQASNQVGTWSDSEIVRVINVGQNRVQNSILTNTIPQGKRAFEFSQRRSDWLRQTVVKNYSLTTLVAEGNSSYKYEPNMQYCVLPSNYKQMITDRSVVKSLINSTCDSGGSNGLNSTLKEFIGIVPFKTMRNFTCSDSATFEVKLLNKLENGVRVDKTIFKVSDFYQTQNYDKINKASTIDLLLSTLNRNNNKVENPNLYSSNLEYNNLDTDFVVYWEQYRDQYYKDHFIFVSRNKDLFYDDDSIAVDSMGVTGTGSSFIINSTSTSITIKGNGLSTIDKIIVSDGTNTDEITSGISASDLQVQFNYSNNNILNVGATPKPLSFQVITTGTPDVVHSTVDGIYLVDSASTASNSIERELYIINNSYQGIYLNIDSDSGVVTTKGTVDTYFTTNPNDTVGDYNNDAANEYSKLGKFQEHVYQRMQLGITKTVDKVATSEDYNNMLEIEEVYRALKNPNRKPRKNKPVSTLAGNSLYIYSDGSFLVDSVRIDYYKTVAKLSLEQDISPEWGDDSLHEWIVEEGVRAAMLANSDPRIGTASQERNFNR